MVNPANDSGMDLEARVRQVVRGCKVHPYRHNPVGVCGQFGERLKSDITISPRRAFPLGLIIQCKVQHNTGSVHQKLLYVHECIKHCYRTPAVIVCDGNSKEIQAAYKWLKDRVGGMLFGVFWFEEFREWFIKQVPKLNDNDNPW